MTFASLFYTQIRIFDVKSSWVLPFGSTQSPGRTIPDERFFQTNSNRKSRVFQQIQSRSPNLRSLFIHYWSREQKDTLT